MSAATPYTWKNVQVHGGGYVDGIVFHPAQANLCYARTDMGGVYRWDSFNTAWIPLTDFLNRDQADYMGNLALALDANNVNKVYVLTGKYTASWAGNGSLLSSSDQGATWSIIALPFKVGGNEDGRGAGERMAVDPNLGTILFAGSNSSGLYKSTNSGAAWSAVASFPGANITFVTFDKASGSLGSATPTIYIGINATTNNVYRSTDAGANWSLVAGQPTGNIPLRAAWGAAGRLYITYSNALGPNGVTAGAVYRLDGGSTWNNLNPTAGQGGWCGVGVFPGASDQVALATLDRWWPADEVYRSTNSGAAWTAKLTGATMDETSAPWVASENPHWLTDIEIDPFNADHAFFVTGYGVYQTTNFSAATPTWSFASTGIEQTVPLQLISPPAGAPLLSAMGDVDGFKHDDPDVVPALRHQPEVGTTLSIAFAEAVPAKMVKTYNWGSPNNYGGFSTNSGANWALFPAYPAGTTGGGTRSIALSPNGTNIVWCPAGAACSYSTNNGSSWTSCGGGMPQGLEPVADRVNSSKFYAADWNTGQVWVSLNGGVSFAVAASGLGVLPSYQAQDYCLKAVLGIEGDLWLCTGSNGLWHSTNSGSTFTKSASFTNAYEIATGKAVAAGYPALYCFGTTGGVRGFHRSDDGGATWTRINDDQHQYGWIHDFSGDPRIYGRLYFSAEGRGIHYGDIPSTGTPTYTVTPSRTPTRTTTASASPTRSATPSVTPNSSSTDTATPTFSATATPSLSPSATSTRSRTASATPTLSATATPSRTASASPSASPSATPSETDVPPGSTLTNTPLNSATPTLTPSSTGTPSASSTGTTSPCATASPSSSASPSGTLTATPSETANGSPTFTATSTAMDSPTESFSATMTDVSSATASVTALATGTSSATATPTSSATPTATFTLTQPAGPALTATNTPVPTQRQEPSGGPLAILRSYAVPNPGPLAVSVELSSAVDDVEMKVWSPAMTLVASSHSGPLAAGWVSVPLPLGFLKNAPNGLCYYSLQAKRGTTLSLPVQPGRFFALR